ncbi:hypothetical protein CPB85DRAFT_1437421 [Mucidula mucida]|nr:hypothetical protein CPB85DRAFT_1437421 [Mucidula mucida]
MAPRSCPTTSQTSYSSTLPVEILSPTAYLRTLYERRDALRRCALDMDVDSDTGKRDTTDALRERVREALQADDPWRQLRHVLKLRSTLCGRRYVGTSLTPVVPLPEPLCFPDTDEEWDELRRKMRTVEKVSGWVKNVEVSVEVSSPVRGKRKTDGSSASPRKKRKVDEEYDLKDPSPLGFVTLKRVRSNASSQPKRESPKVLVPSSSRGSSPAAAPPPRLVSRPNRDEPPPLPAEPTHPSISFIPEDTFFPPSFPSHLVTSTPPNTRTRARPLDIGSEPSSEPRGEMKDLRELLSAARTPSPRKGKKPLVRASSSKLSVEEESLDFGVNPIASAGSAMPLSDDDPAPLYAATQLRGAYDSQFDLDGGLGDLEGFLERDVNVFGEGDDGEEEEKDELDDSVDKSREEDEIEIDGEDESTTFGRWFNLPRRSASTTGSGGGPNWFGRR